MLLILKNPQAPFGSWYWTTELGIGIWNLECQRLGVSSNWEWKWTRIPHDIQSVCEQLPPIRSLSPSYCAALAQAPPSSVSSSGRKNLPTDPFLVRPSKSGDLPPCCPPSPATFLYRRPSKIRRPPSPVASPRSSELPPFELRLARGLIERQPAVVTSRAWRGGACARAGLGEAAVNVSGGPHANRSRVSHPEISNFRMWLERIIK
jgi:hypothetical protein